MEIRIDPAAAAPPYEQVRGQLARMIGDGRLPVGTRLPAVRQLAGDLGLAVNTVARAYRELEGAGLVETRGRHGTVVAPGRDDALDRLHRAATEYAAEAVRLGVPPERALALVRAALDTTRGGVS
ncbi:GntR family transcriptional regulator [Micromonospora sp. DR5-3]|uniref:GntR family transcriptional regulator n=1 Tax=unclassified Micromonospora TaxID=2617518 RepID=UPI0011DAD9EB|nr:MULTISPECIES: GntR family transcriptional regulator [unclassified Micromonospora]MCW3815264.1 GntR family transcriptional regulator [Micromonospora sp. DR5-3]TYC22638.1 GntR family transcriptional regulator [Micromonospora sp. MP36]